MEDQFRVFRHEDFGEFRTVIRDDAPWFVAVDVCRCLEIGNVSMAVSRLDDDEKGISSIDTPGGKQEMIIVSEAGFYGLIMGSRKDNEKTRAFKRWIKHEVLPSIMHTGKYVVPDAAPPAAEKQEPDIVKKNLPPHLTDDKMACVYAVLLAEKMVKIGRSSNFFRRALEIKYQYRLDIIDSYHTGLLPTNMANDIEKACHRTFAALRVQNEVYRANFSDVCAEVSKCAKTVIETNRFIYGKDWPDANELYDKFLTEIPLPPEATPAYIIVESPAAPAQGDPAAAADTLSLKEKIDVLLKCAELAPSDELKNYFLNKIDAMI